MSLVYFMMALMTHSGDSVIVRFDTFALPVPKLITVSRHNGAILNPTVHTWGMSHSF